MKKIFPKSGLIYFLVSALAGIFSPFYSFSQPANDNCASATTLTVNAACTNGTTASATTEGGETKPCGATGTQTVWYKFVAINTDMSVFVDNLLTGGCHIASGVWDNGTCFPTTTLACKGETLPTDVTYALTGLTIGNTYLISLAYTNGGPCGAAQTFCINVTGNVVPPFLSGFETCEPLFIYDGVQVPYNSTATPKSGTIHGQIDGACSGGTAGCYDGSIITGSQFTFQPGCTYKVSAWAKVAVATGNLAIAKSATGTNAAMKSAAGSDIIMAATSVTSTPAYVQYTASFTVTATETKYIGFQMYRAGSGGTAGSMMYLDEISITKECSQCSNGILDGDETSIDCGGILCASAAPAGGTISPSALSFACGSGNFSLTLCGQTGNVQWQSSRDGSTWYDLNGQTGTAFAGTIRNTAYFRVKVTSDGCTPTPAYSNIATVTITGVGNKTWLTSGTNAWGTDANWSPFGFPGVCDNVTIPAGGMQPVITANAACNNLTINSTAILTNAVPSTQYLNIYGDFKNDGTYNDAGAGTKTTLYGGNLSFIGGSGTFTNGNLTVAPNANYTLSSNIQVSNFEIQNNGSLSLSSFYLTVVVTWNQTGNFYANSGTLEMQSGGTLNPTLSDWGTGTLYLNSFTSPFNMPVNDDYYNLRFSNSAGTTNIGTNLTNVRNNFTISSGTVDLQTYTINIGGDFFNNSSFTPSTGTVILNGIKEQNIGGTSSTTFNNLTINNTSATGVIVQTACTVNTTLTLTDGILNTDQNSKYIYLPSTASVSPVGGSVSSYVDGFIQKDGTTAFVFPTGDGSKWRRIAIGVPTASSTFRAKYFNSPYGTYTLDGVTGFTDVSQGEYWILDRLAGTGQATVSLYFEDASQSGIDDCADLRIARWNGISSWWENNNDAVTTTSAGCPTPATQSGNIVTNANVTSFSPFTFGSKSLIVNPLMACTPIPVAISKTNATCPNLCNGSALATEGGGTAPFTYAWSNGGNTASIGPVCAGGYTVTVTDAATCTGTATTTITEPADTIVTSAIAPTTFCAGDAVTVNYDIFCGPWNAGNVFTAQLSDAAGSFAAPTDIGNVTSTTNTAISATIPIGTASGSGYRIRVKSSDIAATGTDNGANLTVSSAMTYSSSTTTQSNTTNTVQSTVNQEIIGIQIVTTGCSSPLSATSFSFNTTGTTAPATDIVNAKVWSTGTSSTFATTTQFGSTTAAPNGAFTITGTLTLGEGTNYFWLTYDVTAGAIVNNFVDGECTSLTVGSAYAPTVTAPAGNRQIIACGNTYTASQSSAYSTCIGTYANLTDGNFNTGPGTNSSASEWIKATFACPKTVSAVSVAGGTINITCAWGAVATPYLNTAVIESSTDDIAWTTRATISGVTDANGLNTFSVGCVTAQYWRIKRVTANYLATTEFSFTFSSSMQYSSSAVTQNNTSVVGMNTTNNEVIGIQIVTTGCSSPLSATSFSLNTTGTTSPLTDISNAKLWYTGTSSTFATTTQFGTTVAAPNGVFTITGTQTLSEGTNYFWLSYDVTAGATVNNFIDGECTSLTVGTAKTPSGNPPAGNRIITTALIAPTFQCVSLANCGCNAVTITIPPCVVQYDLMLAHLTYRPNAGDVGITAPAGWTRINYQTNQNSQTSMDLFYKVATSAEPANYTFTQTSFGSDMSGAILIYRGVDIANPIESSGIQITPAGTSHTTPCITVASDQTMVVAFFGLDGCSSCNLADVVWTPPAGMTERYDIGMIQSSTKGEAGNDVVQAAVGCVQKTATSSLSATGIAAIISLRPSGGPDVYTLMYLGGSTVFDAFSSVTFSKPAQKQDDLMVVHLSAANFVTGPGATPPAGWTLIRFDLDVSGIGAWTYYKVAGASEPNSYTFAVSSGINLMGGIRAYRGIDPAAPFQTSAGATTSGTSHTAPSITTTTDSALVVTFFSLYDGPASYTPPINTTERYDYANVQNHWKTISGDDFVRLTAGSTGTQTATSDSTGSGLAQIASFNTLPGTFISGGCCGFTSITITTSAISPTTYCAGGAVSVSYTITGTFNPANVFTAQLSDVAGSFATPTGIGTLASQVAGTISATIPGATPAGAGYRIRVISSDPVVTGSDNGANLTIDAPPTTANAGLDQYLLNATTTTLAGNTPATGTGNWSVIMGTATITTPSSPTSGVTGLVVGASATLRWTISNGVCPNSTDDVIITVSKTEIRSIECGDNHSLAICGNDSSLRSWGSDVSGQLGDDIPLANQSLPVPVSALTRITAVAGGGSHTLALKYDGMVWAWGSDATGQLGDDIPLVNQPLPVTVSTLTLITSIAGGGSHSLALENDGTVWSWGYDFYGQLGNNLPNTDQPTPVQVTGPTGMTAISAGGNHSLALRNDGTVWSWGRDASGQLGNDPALSDKSAPVLVFGNIIAIAAGGNHSLALKNDGTVLSWGSDINGQLGDDIPISNKPIPVSVSGLTNIVAIAAGGSHSLALKDDGTVWAWGLNTNGQLGDGTITQRNTPVQVSIIPTIIAIAAGSNHSLSLKDDGTAWSWGWDASGQLGNDVAMVQQLTPVQVALPCIPLFVGGSGSCFTINTIKTDVSCNGGNNGSINLTVSGGTPLYTYIWSNTATTEDISGLSAGNYTITINDAASCDTVMSYTITQPATPLSVSETHTDVTCPGGSNGAINITAGGGTPVYTYSWNDGPVTEDRATIAAGTYTVTVTDANNCTATTPITINTINTNSTNPSASAAPATICNGSSSTLSVTGGSLGTGALWKWYSGSCGGTPEGIGVGISVSPASTTTYFVRAEGTCNTTVCATVTVTVNSNPTPTITPGGPTTFCAGGSVILSSSAASSYSWSTLETTQNITVTGSGTYTVTVTDGNGCTGTTSQAVIVNPLPVTSSITGTSIVCADATGVVYSVTNTPGSTYAWTIPLGASITSGAGTNAITVTFGSYPGDFKITETDANGCVGVTVKF